MSWRSMFGSSSNGRSAKTAGIDFTSALYLGMRHGSRELDPWEQLSTGVPAALRENPKASAAVIHAAARALEINERHGDRLRKRLAERIAQLRGGLALIGQSVSGGFFPVQTIRGVRGTSALRLYERLRERGIYSVLSHSREDDEVRLSLLITARHEVEEIARCLDVLDDSIREIQMTGDFHARARDPGPVHHRRPAMTPLRSLGHDEMKFNRNDKRNAPP